MSGCNMLIEARVTKSFEETMKQFQTGSMPQKELDDLLKVFEEEGLTDEGQKDFADAILNMLKKITYTVKSCEIDENNKGTYFVYVDLKTVDGKEIFMSDSFVDELVDFMLEKVLSGEIDDEEQLEKELQNYWAKRILEKSKTADATKNMSAKITVKYDPEKKAYHFAGRPGETTAFFGFEESDVASFQEKLDKAVENKAKEF
jgi:hypothetical protein